MDLKVIGFEGDMSKVINVNQKETRVYEVTGVSLSTLKHILIPNYGAGVA
jgi:hypothetical protein